MNTCTGSTLGPYVLGYDAAISRGFGEDIMIGAGVPWEKVGHCGTVCGFGKVVNHTYCLGTDCRDYVAKVRVGSGESGTTPAPAPDTEPTAAIQSDGRHNPITSLDEREST